jgi:hypothetical protein
MGSILQNVQLARPGRENGLQRIRCTRRKRVLMAGRRCIGHLLPEHNGDRQTRGIIARFLGLAPAQSR